jgi:hypothetical protein
VIGREDDERGVLVELLEHGGREADGVHGVAPHRLAEDAVVGELREGLADLGAELLAGADEPPLGRHEPLDPRRGDLQQRAGAT